MDSISDYFSKDQRISELEKELKALKDRYENMISKRLSTRAESAIKLLKANRLSHAKIAAKAHLSTYHVNRLSSELKKGWHD